MKKNSWILFIDGILGLIVSIGGGIMMLSLVPTAEDKAGLIFGVCFGTVLLVGGPWFFLVRASFFFTKFQIDQHGITKKLFRKTYFLAWDDCAECTLVWVTENTGLHVIDFCATTIPLTQKDRSNLLNRRGKRKHYSDTIFFNCDEETYDLLMTYLPDHWKYRVRADAMRMRFLDES